MKKTDNKKATIRIMQVEIFLLSLYFVISFLCFIRVIKIFYHEEARVHLPYHFGTIYISY